MAIPRPLEQGLLSLAVLGEEISNRLERDLTAEESLDFSVDILHAHFSVGRSKHGLDSTAHIAELTTPIGPSDSRFGSAPDLAAILARERIEEALEVMV